MSSNLRSVFSFALIVLLTGFVENKKFCKSLKENGNEISYGFRRINDKDFLRENYIFIDKTYWRLQMTDDEHKNVSFVSEDGQESGGFGKDYTMAWCHWFIDTKTKTTDCTLGLINSERKTIEWSELDKSQDVLKVVKELDSYVFEFKKDFRPSIAFVANYGQLEQQVVFFIDKTNLSQWDAFRIVRGKTEIEGTWTEGVNTDQQKKMKPTSLKDIPPEVLSKSRVITIFGQYSKYDYDKRLGTGHGLLVLFQEDQTIKYCYTDTEKLSEACKKDLKELKNCQKDETTDDTNGEETTATSGTSENGFNLWIIIVIIVIILIIIAIIFCIFCLKQSKNEPKDTEEPNAVSTTSAVDHKNVDQTRSKI